jgi:hypothetical protein
VVEPIRSGAKTIRGLSRDQVIGELQPRGENTGCEAWYADATRAACAGVYFGSCGNTIQTQGYAVLEGSAAGVASRRVGRRGGRSTVLRAVKKLAKELGACRVQESLSISPMVDAEYRHDQRARATVIEPLRSTGHVARRRTRPGRGVVWSSGAYSLGHPRRSLAKSHVSHR